MCVVGGGGRACVCERVCVCARVHAVSGPSDGSKHVCVCVCLCVSDCVRACVRVCVRVRGSARVCLTVLNCYFHPSIVVCGRKGGGHKERGLEGVNEGYTGKKLIFGEDGRIDPWVLMNISVLMHVAEVSKLITLSNIMCTYI